MEFRDLKAQYLKYRNEIDSLTQDVMKSAVFIGGEHVRKLESSLATYVGVNHCITCANGTDALYLVLRAWGIGKGDAVFVPNFTFFASAEVVSMVGATPVFVDVDYFTFNIDAKKLESTIKKTIDEGILSPKLIMPVDLFGLLADYDSIELVAEEYNLKILEDGAQGFGATYKDRRACSFGDAATTSFFPAKPLGCYGDGGAIFTNDDELAGLIRSYKVHGKGEDKYDNIRIGVNSRLDSIQAAILNVKLKALINHELDDVNRVYDSYNELLVEKIEKPIIPECYRSSFAQYTIKLKSQKQREDLQLFLKQNDIPSMIYYKKTMHQQTAYADMNLKDEDFPVSTDLCKRVLSLPMHPYMTKDDIERVAHYVNMFVGKSN